MSNEATWSAPDWWESVLAGIDVPLVTGFDWLPEPEPYWSQPGPMRRPRK